MINLVSLQTLVGRSAPLFRHVILFHSVHLIRIFPTNLIILIIECTLRIQPRRAEPKVIYLYLNFQTYIQQIVVFIYLSMIQQTRLKFYFQAKSESNFNRFI